MLVSYMQLLGLLRLIELDWREWLKAVQSTLTYLDFTSGVSTWVSVECSFSDAGLLPKSLKRSLVLLMWPCRSYNQHVLHVQQLSIYAHRHYSA